MVFFRMRRSHQSFSCLLWWIMGCVRTVQEECAALISLDSTLSSWICFLATRLFPVLIPKSPRLYSRFPSFLCGGRMKPGIRPQGSFRLNGLERRRTARCKQYFFTWQQAVLFLIDHVCNFFTYMIHPAFAIQLISSILGIQNSREGSTKQG